MGVPAFFRWLSKKYPSIIVHCDDGVKGQYHFDNLYLDMNGIIHPCSHPENKPPPANEEEMFQAIFAYVEDIMKIVRPKKLLYMAVDGVAPRAKMNQQRSRRFRAAQESYEKLIEIQKVKDRLNEQGIEVPSKSDKAHFDSNVITPGTQFMINLSEALRSWLNMKMATEYNDKDQIWPADLVVILSDSSVPGEGEHKIMDYIRRQKSAEAFDANLSHCLYGADADLIMLGLATHEPNFTILREEFKPNQPRPCELCGQIGHELKNCNGDIKKEDEDETARLLALNNTDFIYIRLNVLREYLKQESKICKVPLDFERFIDDYVFLCFFVGNDFLPHLPSLEIRENAIDRLIKLYIYVMEAFPADAKDRYLTRSGLVNKKRVQLVMKELGEAEDDIFRNRKVQDDRYNQRQKRNKLERSNEQLRWMTPEAVVPGGPAPMGNVKEEAGKMRAAYNTPQDKLNAMLTREGEPGKHGVKRKHEELEADDDKEPEDSVQLYNEGYKARYYHAKFHCTDTNQISRSVAEEYFRGMCWVLLYYYQGCPDWKWFFPYHYAPFASDFRNIEQVVVKFDGKAQPFHPLEQLMSVFPAASSGNLPPTWRKMMIEPESPIIDFYPSSFRIDLNGKKAAWMGVALLPFIDEARLFQALKCVYPDLSEEEKERNRLGSHLIFISKGHSALAAEMQPVAEGTPSTEGPAQTELTVLTQASVRLISGKVQKSTYYSAQYRNLYCLEYEDPQYADGFIFPAELLKHAKIPDPVLREDQLAKFDRYRPVIGMERRFDQAGVSQAGRRMLNHSIRDATSSNYSSVYQNDYRYNNNNRGGGGNNYRGGRNDYQGRDNYNRDNRGGGYSNDYR